MKYAKWFLVLALLGGVSVASWQLTQATVTTTAPRNDYVGTGSVDAYDYTFRIFADSDLRVTTEDSAGVVTALALTTDYTVTGVNNANGGTVTLVAGNLASGTTLTIRSDRTPQQSTNLRNQGAFSASTHETKFDELTRYAQQLTDVIKRSIHLPETEVGTDAATELPAASVRASKFLAFDGSGNAITAAGTSADLTPVSSYINTLLDDADASTARTTLGAVNIAGDTMTGDLTVSTSSSPNLSVNTLSGANQAAFLAFSVSGAAKWTLSNDPLAANARRFSIYDSQLSLERFAIDSNGVVEIPAGQLKFPATQSASAGANTLDDYEEGTCTLSSGGTATYTSRDCYYTKIGRQVTLTGTVVINAIGTGSTTRLSWTTVPPAHMVTTSTAGAAGSVGLFSGLSNSKVSIQPRMESGASEVIFYSLAAAGAGNAEAAIIGDGTTINFTCTYFTD